MRLFTLVKGRVCSSFVLLVLAGLTTVSQATFVIYNITATGFE
jgi:hypothetical protein